MGSISTSYISNAALNLTFNELWRKADSDGNGELSRQEFIDMANFSMNQIASRFVSDSKIEEYYNQIKNGEKLDKDKILACVRIQYGIDLNATPNDTIGTIIDRYNTRQEHNYQPGVSVGRTLFNNVSGMGDGDACDILKNMIDENNVLETIEDFNRISSRKGRENIMLYLDNEWGPTAEEMDVIPKSLLKLARKLNLGDTSYYRYLSEVMKESNSYTGDYGEKKAKHLDSAINSLVNRIKAELSI